MMTTQELKDTIGDLAEIGYMQSLKGEDRKERTALPPVTWTDGGHEYSCGYIRMKNGRHRTTCRKDGRRVKFAEIDRSFVRLLWMLKWRFEEEEVD